MAFLIVVIFCVVIISALVVVGAFVQLLTGFLAALAAAPFIQRRRHLFWIAPLLNVAVWRLLPLDFASQMVFHGNAIDPEVAMLGNLIFRGPIFVALAAVPAAAAACVWHRVIEVVTDAMIAATSELTVYLPTIDWPTTRKRGNVS